MRKTMDRDAWTWTGAALVALSTGCAAQTTPSYQGEPLASLSGNVVTNGPAPDSVDAAIVWMTAAQSPAGWTPKLVGTRLPVHGSFPARFTLDVFTPPPAAGAALVNVGAKEVDFEPTGAWLGMIVALRSGVADTDILPSDVLGIDTHHFVLYFDRDVSTSASEAQSYATSLAQIFHVPTTAGYHLASNDPGTPETIAAYDACTWQGLCVKNEKFPDPVVQDLFDWEYARCVAAMPNAPTCTMSSGTSPAEVAETQKCIDLTHAKAQPDCPVPWSHPANTKGFHDPVTITLGLSIWDLYVE